MQGFVEEPAVFKDNRGYYTVEKEHHYIKANKYYKLYEDGKVGITKESYSAHRDEAEALFGKRGIMGNEVKKGISPPPRQRDMI
jgi:hypothetical protein